MKREHLAMWGPAVSVVAIGAAGIIVDVLAPAVEGNAVGIGLNALILASILLAIGVGRRWTRFAWAPPLAFAVSTLGNVIDNRALATGGAIVTTVLVIQHSIQEQRRFRQRPPQVPAHG